MKTLLFLISIIFVGCESRNYTETPISVISGNNISVIQIDSCEYLYAYTGGHTGYMFTHKGNCKFCTQRKCK